MEKICCSLVLMICAAIFTARAGTATWINFTPNTPDTAYDWNDQSNWQNGYVGGEGDEITVTPSETVYIRIPDNGITVYRMQGEANGSHAYLIGGPVTLRSSGENEARWYTSAPNYCMLIVPEGETLSPRLKVADIRGQIINNSSVPILAYSGTNIFRYDYFSRTAGGVRKVEPIEVGELGINGDVISVYGTEGAAACSGRWRLTKGSPYAYRMSDEHKLAVGTAVSAPEGALGEDVFLMRVFDTATIELSAPSETTGEVELSFASLTADFTAHFPRSTRMPGGYAYFLVYKHRAVDSCRIEFDDFHTINQWHATMHGGFNSNSFNGNGTVLFRKFSVERNTVDFVMHCVNLEFDGDETNQTVFPSSFAFMQTRQGIISSMIVGNGKTGIVHTVKNLLGTLRKQGNGHLSLGLGQGTEGGTLKIEGGSAVVCRSSTFSEGAKLRLKSLVLSSGVSFAVPAEGLEVGEFQFEPGAVLEGDGELIVVNGREIDTTALSGLIRRGSVKIRLASLGEKGALLYAKPSHSSPAGHPAFWLDASKADTIVVDEASEVSRWNDCRVGEEMFCTNIVLKPKYSGTGNGEKPYVKIERVDTGKAMGIDETQTLVWSRPISGIKAVFLVQDPVDGGGPILGRTVARCPDSFYGNQGGPYHRSNPNWDDALCNSESECVKRGRFYLNGVQTSPSSGYLGKFLQIVEHHVDSDYPAGDSSYELVCDAFGISYTTPHDYVRYMNGGMRISEYIIYTNELTHAERVQTAQYLARKWLGRNICWSVGDEAGELDVSAMTGCGDVVEVSENAEIALSPVTSGTLVKDGGGEAYTASLNASRLDVLGGKLTVGARSREFDVPPDAYLHVDATEASSIVLTNARSGKAVHSWADVNGIGRELRSIRQQRYPTSSGFPLYDPDSLTINGLACVDLGARQTGNSAGLVVFEADGCISPGQDQVHDSMKAPLLRTSFIVFDSTEGGGALMGGVGSEAAKKGLPHQFYFKRPEEDSARLQEVPICNVYDAASWTGIPAISNACENGTALFRLNGIATNPCTAYFSHTVERMAFRYPDGRRCAVFGAYGGSGICGDYFGGLKYGEIICFERVLSDDEFDRVEAYLARKWFGEKTPGYDAPAVESLSVSAGATLKLLGDDPVNVQSVSGGGMIDGSLTLAAEGEIVVSVQEGGAVPVLTVAGTADLSAGGTVRVQGDVRSLKEGEYRLLSAEQMVHGGGWSIVCTVLPGNLELFVTTDECGMVMRVCRKGMVILIR